MLCNNLLHLIDEDAEYFIHDTESYIFAAACKGGTLSSVG
jgi:hypothetical protein